MNSEQELCCSLLGKCTPDELSRICELIGQIKRDERDRLIQKIRDSEAAIPHLLAKAAADFVHVKMIQELKDVHWTNENANQSTSDDGLPKVWPPIS